MLHPNRYIDYTYGADGSLLRKRQYDNGTLQKTTDYIDGFQYENNTLVYFPMPEGRVLVSDSTYTQEFVLTDQQGNARLSFQNNAGTAKATQENSYYGFGMTMTNAMTLPTTPNKRLYNGGSEWQNDYANNPDYYQTYYRNYDAALGRFVAVDPMAEATESVSVYHYAGDNPVMANDPMGDKMAYNFDPTSPGFNQQVGDVWRESGMATGFTPDYSGPGGSAALLDANLKYIEKEQPTPTAYIVTDDGHIIDTHIVPVNTQKDILISDLTGEELAVTAGVLTPADHYTDFYTDEKGNSKSYTVDVYKLNYQGANEEAKAVFGFLIENTSVEWTHFQYQDNYNIISTSHEAQMEPGGTALALRYSQSVPINLMEHNHPGSKNDLNYYGPSGGIMGDNQRMRQNDMTIARRITQNEHVLYPNVNTVFRVFDMYYNRIVNYDDQNINLGESKYYLNGR